jgi:hypothetical protein
VGAAAAIAIVCALLVVDEARVNSIPALAVAVFGTFLTSMAIIAAFSIEEGSRWPTPWEALDRAHVPAWFVVALGSVVTALLAGALDSHFLSALSLTLALAAVPLGTWALWGLISLSSERGRWSLVVDLLAQSILRARQPLRREGADLGEIDIEDHVPTSFVRAGELRLPQRTGVSIEHVPRVLCEYADRRDLEAIVRLVDEVHAGAWAALGQAGSLAGEDYLRSAETLLYVQRTIFVELANRVLAGQLGDATARIAVVRAGEAALDVAGRVRQVGSGRKGEAEQVERLVARTVTALARFAGHVTQEVDEQLGVRSPAPAAVGSQRGLNGKVALRSTAVELQRAVRWAVDPDPPGMKLPAGHPWREGLSSPISTLIWLWSTVESASAPFGVALYAVCETLTEEKFWESYWDGFDVFTEISRRLQGEGSGAVAEALRRCGGLELLALELGARRLAAIPPRRQGGPAFEGDPTHLDDQHVACELFLAAAGFKPPGRDPVADLAHLLTDRPRGSLWTTVLEELRELPDDALLPPLQPLCRRPEACALAVCLRLAPLAEEPEPVDLAPIEELVSLLPAPLLERTARLGVAIVSGERCDGDRAELERRLIEAARFARLVTPGDLPAQEAQETPQVREPAPVPSELLDSGFGEAQESIAGAERGLRVDLIQLDPRWLDEWADLRAELDAQLLAGALRGALQLRRVILYDLPGSPPPPVTRLHYRWREAIAAAVHCFPRDQGGEGSYEARQILATRFGSLESLPRDGISIRSAEDDGSSSRFESLWLDRGSSLIEL